MGFRFRRTITIFPGLRLNISKSGVSVSAGPRGASVSFGKRGAFANIGMPGTGVSYRSRLNKLGGIKSRIDDHLSQYRGVRFSLSNDLRFLLLDDSGKALSSTAERVIRRVRRQDIIDFLHEECVQKNAVLMAITPLHFDTDQPTTIQDQDSHFPVFTEPKPAEPRYHQVGWLDKLPFWAVSDKELANQQLQNDFSQSMNDWETRKQQFESDIQRIWKLRCKDKSATEDLLRTVLGNMVWPLQILTRLSVSENMDAIWISVELPASDKLPSEEYCVVENDLKLSKKTFSELKLRKLYMHLAHSVGFRLIGKIFAIVPVNWIVVTVYSPRINSGNGQEVNECLYSVQVKRNEWNAIEFSHLDKLYLPDVLGSFQIRRNMTDSGIFQPVTPFQ